MLSRREDGAVARRRLCTLAPPMLEAAGAPARSEVPAMSEGFVYDPFGRRMRSEQLIDTTELKRIAKLTEGRFFRAKDREGLEAAYAEIEALEKTPLEERRFVEHYDLYYNFLFLAFFAWILGWASDFTWARRLP